MLDLEILLQVLVLGLTNGALLALVALGYTLVYGIIELINFAHGDVYMIGTFTALTVVLGAGLSRSSPPLTLAAFLLLALALAMLVCAALNAVIERVAYRPLRHAPRLAPLITAIGVSFILMNVGLYWYGASQVRFPDILPNIDLLQALGLSTVVRFSTKDLFVLVVTVPLLLLLNLFIYRTRLGKAMRATAEDRDAAALVGIDINRTIALAFIIGGALAGAAGFLSGLYNNTAWFQQGFRAGLMAFTSAVLGGIGNPTGAVLGGLVIGVVAAITDFYLDPRWTQAVVFGILIVLLVFRPSGLLGEQVPEKV
ncbi:MAG TPA: branched-chain amino acid ABC transporter permease [Chloroflexota bacterium]|jgi:branched-chain amino acid transport system permease protein|nr:branched-chain amino acid ABC transporter permease [Chloroflexota bacterium]